MGHKKLCLDCRLTLNIAVDDERMSLDYPCPSCQENMILLPHRFRPPKKSDDQKWNTVAYLLEQGFRYEHTYSKVPENLRDAKEFWEKHEAMRDSDT